MREKGFIRRFIRWIFAGMPARHAIGQNFLPRIAMIKRSSSLAMGLAVMVLLAVYASVTKAEAQTELKLAVNDISYLWPVPGTQAEVDQLIDGESVWPESSFQSMMKMALEVEVLDGVGRKKQIEFPSKDFNERSTWKVVGFRVDPSAPSTNKAVIEVFGSLPQIRLIMQPVTVTSNGVVVHDYTAHLAFSYLLNAQPPFKPDREKFAAILHDLRQLKGALSEATPPVSTEGELRVHPGLAQNVSGFSEKVKLFLNKHLAKGALDFISFIGVPAPLPEPWIFFEIGPGQTEVPKGEMLSPFITVRKGAVTPVPKNSNLGGLGSQIGVSTAVLFRPDPKLDQPAVTGRAEPLNKDAPDIIANPTMSNVLNTDCVSCHSETTRRSHWKIGPTNYQFKLPDGIPGGQPALLPEKNYNVRNFGWCPLGIN